MARIDVKAIVLTDDVTKNMQIECVRSAIKICGETRYILNIDGRVLCAFKGDVLLNYNGKWKLQTVDQQNKPETPQEETIDILVARIQDKTKDILGMKLERYELIKKMLNRAAKNFEKKNGIKKGDRIIAKDGITYFYDGFAEGNARAVVLCHPAKKDGTPSKAIKHLQPRDFGDDQKNLEWILHIK